MNMSKAERDVSKESVSSSRNLSLSHSWIASRRCNLPNATCAQYLRSVSFAKYLGGRETTFGPDGSSSLEPVGTHLIVRF